VVGHLIIGWESHALGGGCSVYFLFPHSHSPKAPQEKAAISAALKKVPTKTNGEQVKRIVLDFTRALEDMELSHNLNQARITTQSWTILVVSFISAT